MGGHGKGEAAQASFDADTASVSAARHFVSDRLRVWRVDDGVAWSAALAVTELAANAVLHAATPFTVVVSRDGGSVRLAVSDSSVRRPRTRHYGADATTGRGLALVASLSAEWGSQPLADGKTVWCVLLPDDAHERDVEPDLTEFDDFDEGSTVHVPDATRLAA